MTGSAKYSPDGKGGYIGSTGSAPGVGDTIVYTPNRIGAGGGLPGVGDTIEYSSDGKGGFIGCCPGAGRPGLWYWISNGSSPRTWPTGSGPGWRKTLLMEEWPGRYLKFKLDRFWGTDGTPHLFWVEGDPYDTMKLVHYWRLPTGSDEPEGEWVQEDVPLPEGYFPFALPYEVELPYFPYVGWGGGLGEHYDMDILNGAIYIAVLLAEGYPYTWEDWNVKLYALRKESTDEGPGHPEYWTFSHLMDVSPGSVACLYPPSISVDPWWENPHVRVVFADIGWDPVNSPEGGLGVVEIRELDTMVWSSPDVIRPFVNYYSSRFPKLAISGEGKSAVVMTDFYYGTRYPHYDLEIYEKPWGASSWTRLTKDPTGGPGAYWVNTWSTMGQYEPLFYEGHEDLIFPVVHWGSNYPDYEGYLPTSYAYIPILRASEDEEHSVAGWYEEDRLKRRGYYIPASLAASIWRAGVAESYCHQQIVCNRGVLDYTYFSLSGATFYTLEAINSMVRRDSIGIDGVEEFTVMSYIPGVGWSSEHHPPKSHIVFYQYPP